MELDEAGGNDKTDSNDKKMTRMNDESGNMYNAVSLPAERWKS